MCVAVCLDVGLGILIFYILSRLFHYSLPWYWYSFAAFFSLFMDTDIFFKKGEITEEHHRFVTHCPLPMFFLSAIAVFCLAIYFGAQNRFAWFLIIAALACMFSHYLHDSVGNDTKIGIKWLWPLNNNFYIFYNSGCYGVRRNLRIISTESPVDSIDRWLEKYSRPTKRATVGVVVLLIAITVVILW
jgi:hypothetical protein